MRIYKVNLEYIKYLHEADYRVQYNKNYTDAQNQNRPYIGPVLKKDGLFYFAPLEHPRPEHENLKESSYFVKIIHGKYGLIGINNMIPIPREQLINFDISTDKNSKVLISQLVFCRKNSKEIQNKARKTYFAKTNPATAKTQHTCCDYKLLSKKCWEHIHQTQGQELGQNNESTQATAQTPQNEILPNEIAGGGFTQSF